MGIRKLNYLVFGFLALASFACQTGASQKAEFHPLSDPDNKGGWILNHELSDEFEGQVLDENKWFVQGTDGGYCNWKGRAPSQFAPHNVRLEGGKLKLHSQWEADFDFARHKQDGRIYENITTAGVISRKRFLHGYMEIKSKAGDAAMTSSFWTLGYQSELDMFEMMGAPKQGKQLKDNYYLFSIHDWRPGVVAGKNKIFTHAHKLDYRVADDFHVYGCEWDDKGLKFYADGELVYVLSREEMGDNWVLTNPLEIWFDSEVFPWLGIPVEDDLPVDFEIEYVRIWQKPDPNLLDRSFFGFEGPILLEEVPKPERLNKHYKQWIIHETSSPYLLLSTEKYAGGRKSLKFTCNGKNPPALIESPGGSVYIPAGDFKLSLKIWMEAESKIKSLHLSLENPDLMLDPINLSELSYGEWTKVDLSFSRNKASGTGDRLNIELRGDDLGDSPSILYIDDLSISAL